MSTIDRLFKKADEKKKANHSGDPFLLFSAEEELDADESRHSAHDNDNEIGLSSTEQSRGAVPPEDVLGTSAPNQQEGADLEPGDLQWPLTGAFQYCFYYVLFHTNPPNRERDGILAEEDFMVANKVLKLTLDNHHEDNNTVKGTAASELLLQLCLSPPFHQPSYFSRLYFEQHCPPSFPVKEALETLTATEMIWHFTHQPNRKQPSGAKYFAEPLLHVLNGEKMAVLFRTLYSLQENHHHAPQTSSKKIEALQRKIKSILLVLRVGELKEFIQAFLPSSTTNNNIPSTKLEMIHSLLANPPPSSSSSAVQLQRLEESWRYTIGDIYQPHQTVKKSILFIVRLFHCMNGSFLSHSLTNPPSGETFPRDVLNISNKSKISFLREVMDSLHNPNDNDNNNNNNNIRKSLAAIYNHLSVPFPILYPFQQRLMCFLERNRSHQRWGSSFPFPPWIPNSTPHHAIFHPAAFTCKTRFSEYETAFHLFLLINSLSPTTTVNQRKGNSTATKELLRHNTTIRHSFALSLYHLTKRKFEEAFAKMIRESKNSTHDNKGVEVRLLQTHSVLAQHVLFFHPLFFYFSSLELLFPILQSNSDFTNNNNNNNNKKCYVEANWCLETLIEKPLFVLFENEMKYNFYYKPHKKAEWIYRLSLNLIHLKENEKSLLIMQNFHRLYIQINEYFNQQSKDGRHYEAMHFFLYEHHSLSGTPQSDNRVTELYKVLPSTVQRRSRVLRALFPHNTPHYHNSHTSTFSAVFEHFNTHYYFSRRSDVLKIEKSLLNLLKKVRKWTPVPKENYYFSPVKAFVSQPHDNHHHCPTLLAPEMVVEGEFHYLNQSTSTNSKSLIDIAKLRVDAPMTEENNHTDTANWKEVQFSVWSRRHIPTHDNNNNHNNHSAGREIHTAGVEDFCLQCVLDDLNNNNDGPHHKWEGLHGEGMWIEYIAKLVLLDIYYEDHPLCSTTTTSDEDGEDKRASLNNNNGNASTVNPAPYLSPFQEMPFDLIVNRSSLSFSFIARNYTKIKSRLRWLKYGGNEKEDASNKTGYNNAIEVIYFLLPRIDKYAAYLRKMEKKPPPSPPPAVTTDSPGRRPDEVRKEEDPSSLLLPSSPSPRALLPSRDEETTTTSTEAEDNSGSTAGEEEPPTLPIAFLPPPFLLPPPPFPLLSVLLAIPPPHLADLLAVLLSIVPYPSPTGRDYYTHHNGRFSGFPDLFLWRNPLQVEADRDAEELFFHVFPPEEFYALGPTLSERFTSPQAKWYLFSEEYHQTRQSMPSLTPNHPEKGENAHFRLIEVKGPNDELSTGQMVIHHILQHCGFEVSVARVVNANDSTDGRRRAKRTSGRGGPHPNRKRQRDSLNGNGSDRHRPAPATVIDIDGGES